MIDRYQLRYFLAVVDAGNFSRAAGRVNVTQPTLSVGISKLEQTLGAKLFFRNSQRVHLTEAGVRFLGHARAIEREFNALETRMTGMEAVSVVRLGVLTTIPVRLLEALVAANATAPQRASLELVEGAERDLTSRLQEGRIDLAVALVRPGETRFVHEVLFEEGYALAVPERHRFAQAGLVEAEDLADEVMIVRRHCEALSDTSRYFTEHGVRPRFSYRTTNDERSVAMVRAGLGITVMPDSYRENGVLRPKLAGFEARRTIGLVHRSPPAEADAATRSVAASVRAVFRALA